MGGGGLVTRMGDKSGAHRVLVGNPDGKSPVGRPRPIWEGNIKMNLLDLDGEAWTGLMYLREEKVGGRF